MADDAPAAGSVEPPRLEQVDPRHLRTGANVRTDLRLAKEFVDSVRQHGVLEPIVGHRGPDGVITIAYGHRRAAAAIDAGLSAVPVLVRHDATGADAGADRILAQVIENDQREALTTAERVGAYQQLAAFGLSAQQIARRAAARRADVEQSLKVAGSELATAAAARYDLTLDQAAVVSEFAEDKDAVKALVAGVKTGQFAHVAQRLRDQRDFDNAVATLTSELTDQGVTVLDERPDLGSRGGRIRRLADLAHDGQPLNADGHQQCPGHAAYLERSWGDEIVRPVWVCRDPAGNGHTDRNRRSTSADGPGKELSVQEKEERRQVRQNNTDWRSAEKVRREFLRQLLGRKTAPPGARRFVAEAVVAAGHPLRRALERGHPMARELLGLDSGAESLASTMEGTTDHRAEMITLGSVLAAYEDATGVHSWRQADKTTRHYLDFLRSAGYQLSALEETIASPTAPTVVDQATPRVRRREPGPRAADGAWASRRTGATTSEAARTPPSVA